MSWSKSSGKMVIAFYSDGNIYGKNVQLSSISHFSSAGLRKNQVMRQF
jgi:hypothetical protein